jgi:DNA repair photolyase
VDGTRKKGRAAVSNRSGRYEPQIHEAFDDGWGTLESLPETIATTLTVDTARRVITYNQSPDVPFDRSINPYRGCEHGCIYCFARPTHTWLGLSAGLDFETRLIYKPNAPERLKEELASPKYRCQPLALGINTDAYQPVERRLELTRSLLEVLSEAHHPVSIVTKSSLIERDLDLLAPMAADRLLQVSLSITTLSRPLARRIEPRAAAPQRRLQTIEKLAEAGIPTSVMVAPLIPVLTDSELETVLAAAKAVGARSADYVLLRLPHETKELFKEWLAANEPLKAEHVMQRVRDTRSGKEYDAAFGKRLRGEGLYANLLAQRFRLAKKRLGFAELPPFDTGLFTPPVLSGQQMSLF